MSSSALHAILYDDGASVGPLSQALVAAWRHGGLRVAGLVEDHVPRSGRRTCDMVLHELSSGTRILISEDRGPLARGCRLDVEALLRAAELVHAALGTAEILILNKFGKLECEGGGLRGLIAEAIDAAVPTVIFVPGRNLTGWRSFVGSLSVEWNLRDLPLDGTAAAEVLGLASSSPPMAELGESGRH